MSWKSRYDGWHGLRDGYPVDVFANVAENIVATRHAPTRTISMTGRGGGLAAMQLAHDIGAVPIAITRSPHKRDALLTAGRVMEITNKGSMTPRAVLARRSALIETLYEGTELQKTSARVT
jgi:D-arabinose 1-dehydrogenase-like Zn-dependent alcohol dehydrogenase